MELRDTDPMGEFETVLPPITIRYEQEHTYREMDFR